MSDKCSARPTVLNRPCSHPMACFAKGLASCGEATATDMQTKLNFRNIVQLYTLLVVNQNMAILRGTGSSNPLYFPPFSVSLFHSIKIIALIKGRKGKQNALKDQTHKCGSFFLSYYKVITLTVENNFCTTISQTCRFIIQYCYKTTYTCTPRKKGVNEQLKHQVTISNSKGSLKRFIPNFCASIGCIFNIFFHGQSNILPMRKAIPFCQVWILPFLCTTYKIYKIGKKR